MPVRRRVVRRGGRRARMPRRINGCIGESTWSCIVFPRRRFAIRRPLRRWGISGAEQWVSLEVEVVVVVVVVLFELTMGLWISRRFCLALGIRWSRYGCFYGYGTSLFPSCTLLRSEVRCVSTSKSLIETNCCWYSSCNLFLCPTYMFILGHGFGTGMCTESTGLFLYPSAHSLAFANLAVLSALLPIRPKHQSIPHQSAFTPRHNGK